MFQNLGNLWTAYELEQKALAMGCSIQLPENIKDEILQSVMVLLVSANVYETSATCNYLRPLDGHKRIYKFEQNGEVVCYIGKYGACSAAVLGNVEVEASTRTISTLVNQCFCNLCAVVSIGVACGIKGKVQMCDVLVSSQVVNYDKVPDHDDHIYLPREKPLVSPWLKKLFFQPADWPDYTIKARLIKNDIPMPNVMSGVILSGSPYHVDDPAMNNFVCNFAGEAIGIEMQRAHHFTANTANAIIVKAVCDFGDGKNNEEYQSTAALLAADLVHVCLSDHQASKELTGLRIVFII